MISEIMLTNKMDKKDFVGKLRTAAVSINALLEDLEKTESKQFDQSLDDRYRVIHLRDNPTDLAIKSRESDLKRLKEENARLKTRIELLESGHESDVTRRVDSVIDNEHKVEILNQKVAELQNREKKILDSFRKTSREFREVCYLLTGYRIDALKDNIYRLSHMYAEHEEDKLLFEVKRDGTILLLNNEYTEKLSHSISTYLENADSFPAFLASITLDLFKSSTHSIDMSISMSTTIQPNPRYESRG